MPARSAGGGLDSVEGLVGDFAELHGNFQHNPDRVAKVLRSLADLQEYVCD